MRFLAVSTSLACLMGTLAACGASAPTPSAPPPSASSSATESPSKAAAAAKAGPAPAARRPVTHSYFGTAVVDDYEWLEDAKNPDVRAFLDAENAYADSVLQSIDVRPALRKRLAELLGATSVDYLAVRRTSETGPLFVLERQPPKQQSVLMIRPDPNAPGRRVVDPNELDPTGSTTIDFFVPSPDGKLVAVSLSKDGSERGDVHVFDVATGKEGADVVEHVNGGTAGGSLAWNADGSGFFYTRYPKAGERAEADLDFFQQVWFHKLGASASSDTYSIGKDFPRIAEGELERSDDGRFVMAIVANGDGGEYEHHVLDVSRSRDGAPTSSPGWRRLSKFDDELTFATFGPGKDGKIYAVSRKGAPRGKVVAFTAPFDKPAEVVLPEGEGVIEEVVVTKSALYVVELLGGPSRIRRIPLGVKAEPLARDTSKTSTAAKKPKKGAPAPRPTPPASPTTIAPGARGVAAAELPIPPVSSVTAVVRMGEDLLVRIESYTEPPAWFRYRADEHRLVKTAMAKAAPADMRDVEVVRESCVSKDGTKVPMSILRRTGTKLDGTNPTLVTGYGGFGLSRKPRLRNWYRAWLDAGGVMVEANLRGGGEMGEAWHSAGKLLAKQNVFDDFYACAKTLVARNYTTPDKLAIWGRSNGGLLMGAALVQHPEAYRAVVSGVGIYDMLRTELSPNGAFNVTEYGTVKDEAQFRAMYAYSPLHNVKDGVRYPSVLLTTGENDPRVDPYQSRKMAARLRAANAGPNPILLQSRSGTGHGMGTPLSAEIEEMTDMLAFLFHELGMR
ncbi:Prolyl endopeptidase [Labilithrix luteola]|uniref:prolyl oligopeptidase n=1 Tax=Labilithrix luteola TaxID=1391654 RepID=A0A0K1QBS7_9BACT|nr:prolyl oligopeptidase family serine peptidase [Labilithrix luteola]AKV03127.1 Prolyl endopeptidase [Labilithrix luteola]